MIEIPPLYMKTNPIFEKNVFPLLSVCVYDARKKNLVVKAIVGKTINAPELSAL